MLADIDIQLLLSETCVRLRGGTVQFDDGALLFYFSEIEAKYVLPLGIGFFFDYFLMFVVARYVSLNVFVGASGVRQV